MSGDGESKRSKTETVRASRAQHQTEPRPTDSQSESSPDSTDEKTPAPPTDRPQARPRPTRAPPGARHRVSTPRHDQPQRRGPVHHHSPTPHLRTGRSLELPPKPKASPTCGSRLGPTSPTRGSGGPSGEPQPMGEKGGGKETSGRNQGARLAQSRGDDGGRESLFLFDPLTARSRRTYIAPDGGRRVGSWPHRSRHEHYDGWGAATKKDATNGVRS